MVTALLDHLWQSTVFAAAIGLLVLAMRENGAHVRYGLWLAASIKFLLPFALLSHIGSLFAPALPVTPLPLLEPVIESVQPLAQPFSGDAPVVTVQALTDTRAPLILFGLWALGFAAILILRLTQWIRVERALWSAAPVSMAASVPVKASPLFLEPGLVGISQPALLLPEDIMTRLTTAELNAVMAHEHSHLRRRDNLTAALHMFVEALFWFYPLVWWIGTKLIDERERACDESVLAEGNDAEVYAESILKVCRSYIQSPIAVVSGVSGANLKKRIETIMSPPVIQGLNAAKRAVLALGAIATLSAPFAAGLLTPFESGASMPVVSGPANAPEAIAARRTEQERPRVAVSFAPENFDKYAGYYMLKPDVIMTIMRRGTRFFGRISGGPSIEFYPESETKFFATVVPAQVSFVMNPQGRVTGLIQHQNGMERLVPRMDIGKVPGNETEVWLRNHIAALEKGELTYADMTPEMANVVRAQQAATAANIKRWGALRGLEFQSINYMGQDVYRARFENADVEWTVSTPNPEGKFTSRGYNEITPAK